ncbi:hypothetical protein ACQUQU_08580 [Thalassolituus sp. LLYu03]|uniref:hypothetical protein n=1 Tax=Thalassolituus sp. LLYu03 TaxID=3421656 RepID=UPI003D2D0868
MKAGILALSLLLAWPVMAEECRDKDAKAAGDTKALSYFRQKGEIFHPARVLKVHHPSRFKEVASYVKYGDKHYSIFTLVNTQCVAHFRKRTRQGD